MFASSDIDVSISYTLPISFRHFLTRNEKQYNKVMQLIEGFILNGKREPDVHFLKAIHEKLGIEGNFILEHV